MPIHVNCPMCGRKLTAPDSAEGSRGKCPGCGEMVRIVRPPELADATAALEAEPTQPAVPVAADGGA